MSAAPERMSNSMMLAIEWVLQSEGDTYTQTAHDRGGPTRYGVTLAALTAYRGRPTTADDVAALTRDEAIAFYNNTYVLPLRLAQFDRRIATVMLDNCVVMGIGPGVKLAQRITGQLTDGVLGGKTQQALASMPSLKFVAAYIVAVQKTYVAIVSGRPDQIVFLNGWLARSQRYLQLMT